MQLLSQLVKLNDGGKLIYFRFHFIRIIERAGMSRNVIAKFVGNLRIFGLIVNDTQT